MKPELSIIVPVYNIDQYLRKCLDSIIAQTFKNIEIIVINDGSTDQSGTICDEYAKKDQRLRVIHKEHGGVSASRNTGISQAQGAYIGFVDGDDYVRKNMYEMLYGLCIKTESDIAICKLGREVDGKLINQQETSCLKKLTNQEAMCELFKGNLYRFSLCNKLFHKRVFSGIQFPEGRIHEDLSTTYKLFSKANQAVYTSEVSYIYVKRKNSILTSTYHEKRMDAFIGWDEILGFMERYYPGLSKTVNDCFAYHCIDHFYYILNQVEDKDARRRYLNKLQLSTRRHYRQMNRRTSLTLSYKLIFLSINYNMNLLIWLNQMKRSMRSLKNLAS